MGTDWPRSVSDFVFFECASLNVLDVTHLLAFPTQATGWLAPDRLKTGRNRDSV